MKQTTTKFLRGAVTAALFGGMIFTTPQLLQAKTPADISVHVTVNVHGSDVGVSPETLEETVDKLLEAAHIEVSETGGSNITELKIDIFKEDDGFKADANWDEDGEPEVEKHCAEQDEIDNIVEEEVNAFIEFIHHG